MVKIRSVAEIQSVAHSNLCGLLTDHMGTMRIRTTPPRELPYYIVPSRSPMRHRVSVTLQFLIAARVV